MMIKYSDCHCEDYPCCGHYDTVYGDEQELREYDEFDHDNYDPDEDEDLDDEDYCEGHESLSGPMGVTQYCDGSCKRHKVKVNAFGQRLRHDAPELPGDHFLEDAQEGYYDED